MSITTFKAQVIADISSKTTTGSITPANVGDNINALADIFGQYFDNADPTAQPYLKLNYPSVADTRLYAVGNLSTLVNTGNGLASYIGGTSVLGAFTAKHLTAKGGALQVEGVASDARAILNAASGYAPLLRFAENGTARGVIGYQPGGTAMQIKAAASDMNTGTLAMSVFSDGRVGFNTTTNAGYLADFNGTVRFQNHVYTGSSSNLYLGTTNAYLAGNGSSTVSLYAFNGILMGDYEGTTYNSSVASGAVTGSAIPRPLVVGSSTLSQCAALQVVSTTRGFMPPVLTSTQTGAMSNLQSGCMVHNSTTNKTQVYDGTAWNNLW
ncbi:MAG: hypothetical protein ACK4EY_16150 [Flavipsychrobacter sp.]